MLAGMCNLESAWFRLTLAYEGQEEEVDLLWSAGSGAAECYSLRLGFVCGLV